MFLLSCVSKKEAKKATRRLTALRVPSLCGKTGATSLLYPVFSLASAASQSGKVRIKVG